MENKFPKRYWINDSNHHLDEEAPDIMDDKPCQGPLRWQASFKEYLSIDEHNAILQAERDRARGLVEAIEDIRLQFHGLKNNWCGMWFNCVDCNGIYAIGGNWTVNNQKEADGKCHYCRAIDALAKYRGEK